MRINVAQLLKEPIGTSRVYDVDETFDSDNINHVKGKVTLMRIDQGILVQGTITADVMGMCSRCLEQIHLPVTSQIDEQFFPTTDITTGSPLRNDPDNFTIDHNHSLDMGEAIRQYTMLAIPSKLLCHPYCAGICPSCGHNLNQSSCACPSHIYDKRWSKLVHLGKENRP